MELRFTCPDCGAHELEEIIEGAWVASKVWGISAPRHPKDSLDIELEYGEVSHEDGAVVRYQCSHCGKVLKDSRADVVETPLQLVEWLRERGMLEVFD